MANEITVNQIWKDKDRRKERFVKILAIDRLDVFVRSCDLQGEFCPKTPRTYIAINRLKTKFRIVVAPATITSRAVNA